MSPGQRGSTSQHAKRVNAAARLLASGLTVADAARLSARQFSVSVRQARRYAEEARDLGLREIPKPKVVFTVKLPVDLIKRLRRNSKTNKRTLSSLVTQALEEFLIRMPDGTYGSG
jgi:predicted DNA-binding transcriptional regulator YafY